LRYFWNLRAHETSIPCYTFTVNVKKYYTERLILEMTKVRYFADQGVVTPRNRKNSIVMHVGTVLAIDLLSKTI